MAYFYKCSISFGLVYILVTLHASVKTQDVVFNMLDKKTMSRVKYKKTCEECDGREVKQEDIVKGYEYKDDKYVVFTEEDFEKLKTKKDKNITIQKFVDIAQIDAIYYDRPYYLNLTMDRSVLYVDGGTCFVTVDCELSGGRVLQQKINYLNEYN